ncbi:MAG: hypothetical protein Q9172_005938 [Xanthocarpia lactea]
MATVCAFQLDDRIFNTDLYSTIEAFWFQGLPPGATTPPCSLTARWFGLGSQREKDEFNSTCSSRFKYVLEAIGPEKLTLPSEPGSDDDGEERGNARALALPFLLQLGKSTTTMMTTDKHCSAKGNINEKLALAKSAMSMIILLDQLPRNIYKASPQMATVFRHYDRLAQALSLSLLLETTSSSESESSYHDDEGGAFPTTLLHQRPDLHPFIKSRPVYREWFYLPLQHSEHLSHHTLLSQLISAYRNDIAESGGEAEMREVDSLADFERRHVVLLERFERYPYRNDVLGREITIEEKQWLENGGETFGF